MAFSACLHAFIPVFSHTAVHCLIPILPFHCAQTFVVGDVDEHSKQLIKTSHDCLAKAIAMCKPGVRYRDVGDVISKHAQANGCVQCGV